MASLDEDRSSVVACCDARDMGATDVSTRQVHPITELATRATALIPEPPVDAVSFVAWRELVWETARRLADLSVTWPSLPQSDTGAADLPGEVEWSAAHLLRLAALFRDHAAQASGDVPAAAATKRSLQH